MLGKLRLQDNGIGTDQLLDTEGSNLEDGTHVLSDDAALHGHQLRRFVEGIAP